MRHLYPHKPKHKGESMSTLLNSNTQLTPRIVKTTDMVFEPSEFFSDLTTALLFHKIDEARLKLWTTGTPQHHQGQDIASFLNNSTHFLKGTGLRAEIDQESEVLYCVIKGDTDGAKPIVKCYRTVKLKKGDGAGSQFTTFHNGKDIPIAATYSHIMPNFSEIADNLNINADIAHQISELISQ